jgi:chromosome segregation ATPase
MKQDEQNTLRAILREEVNAAVYASEQRLGERLDQMSGQLTGVEGRLTGVEGRLTGVEDLMTGVEERLSGVEGRVSGLQEGQIGIEERLSRAEVIQKQMAVNLVKVSTVLDEATIKINELQMSQIALEQKVEENTGTLKRDMQKLTYTVRGFMDNVTDAIAGITVRLDMHKDTPINEAHPHSAA